MPFWANNCISWCNFYFTADKNPFSPILIDVFRGSATYSKSSINFFPFSYKTRCNPMRKGEVILSKLFIFIEES